jgi:hypothetical protein
MVFLPLRHDWMSKVPLGAAHDYPQYIHYGYAFLRERPLTLGIMLVKTRRGGGRRRKSTDLVDRMEW